MFRPDKTYNNILGAPSVKIRLLTRSRTFHFSPFDRSEQLYPPSSAQNQLYSPARANADTNLRAYPDTRVAVQRLPTKAIPQVRK